MKKLTFFILIVSGIAALSSAQTPGDAFRQEGIASWYGREFDGRPTASGEVFNSGLYTAAHPTLPFGTILTVTNTQNNRKVTVKVNDRGPFVAARIIDLSMAAAEVLDMLATGTAPVILERAANNTLGPVGGALIASSPVPPASPPSQEKPNVQEPEETPSAVSTPQETIPAPAITPVQITPPATNNSAIPAAPVPAATPLSVTPPVPPIPAAQVFPLPPAEIKGVIPPAESTSLYRLQVGAYAVPRNAVDAFDKLKNAGLSPAYERNGDFYRVVLAGLKAGELQRIAQILGNLGFAEALIREETGY